MTRYPILESWQRQDILALYRKGRGLRLRRATPEPTALARDARSPRRAWPHAPQRAAETANRESRMNPDDLAEAIRRYDLGFSCAEIAGHRGGKENRIRDSLRAAGVTLRGAAGGLTSPLITPAVLERAQAMFDEGHAVAAIAAELGVPRKPLRQALKAPTRKASDEALSLPIGELPAGHPFAALDAEMAAAREKPRHAYEVWPATSSIAGAG